MTPEKKTLLITSLIILLGSALFFFCEYSSVDKKNINKEYSDSLEVDIIKSERLGGYYSIKIKITNSGNRDIHNALATCILLDQNEQEIDFKKHYVIKSTEGGLVVGRSTYFTFSIGPINQEATSVKIKWDSIKFK